jgi:hypothetical protein
MGIKKYYSNKDNTITNAFKANLITRGTGSNMGASDMFPISSIQSDISSGVLPADTGSIKFHLNLYNAPHGSSTPEDFTLDLKMLSQSWTEGRGLDLKMLSQSWTEGRGLDMDNYSDLGVSNWISASSGVSWSAEGGSVITGLNTSASVSFDTGLENISIDVSEQVYKWLDTTDNYGFLIRFPDSAVSGSDSLYTYQ